jgi:predicted  nucleic acid-binding Zn-ribbon protein
MRETFQPVAGRKKLSAEKYRMRIAELNTEIEKLGREMNEKRSKGKPVHDLEKRLDQLEREKHDLVEQIEALWSA